MAAPTPAASVTARLKSWAESKIDEWATAAPPPPPAQGGAAAEGGEEPRSLRQRFPRRPQLDAWLAQQSARSLVKVYKRCERGTPPLGRVDPRAWQEGKAVRDQHEWLCDVYRMRCDDMYCHAGDLVGLMDPGRTRFSLMLHFATFAKLAVRHGVVQPEWDWRAFLDHAKTNVHFAFEKADAQKKYGQENFFAGPRSLRYMGVVVYGYGPTVADCPPPYVRDIREEMYSLWSVHHHIVDEMNVAEGSPAWHVALRDRAEKHQHLFLEVGGLALWLDFAETMDLAPIL